MSTVNLTLPRIELAKRDAETQRAREDELKTLRAETEMLREQLHSIMHEINNLRSCMQKQTDVNEHLVELIANRTSP
ncbi:MAG: hypothetical protein ACK4ZU_04060 [Allorhizobium sp.]